MENSTWIRVKLIAGLIVLMVGVHIINTALDGGLNQFGVIPRSIDTWYHIASAPFIHGSFSHLFNNLMGLTVFSALCLLRSIKFYLLSSLFIILLSGLLVWLFGRTASHIGASVWIFGLWSLSIAIAWFDRRFKNILIGLLVILFYGGMIAGVLPTDRSISFEGHLFGVISGIICAFLYTSINKLRNRRAGEVV